MENLLWEIVQFFSSYELGYKQMTLAKRFLYLKQKYFLVCNSRKFWIKETIKKKNPEINY